MMDRTDTQWYRDAIIYQLHVKSFFDANNDGIGDFIGVTQKLDYVKELGATAIWVMPFYPSPLRDDGYDISDYRGINPSYGAGRDFKAFVKAAHDRGHPRHHRTRHQSHVGPAPVVPAGAGGQARLGGARLLRVVRRRRKVRRHPHHLPRHREVELDLGRAGASLLLAPLLLAPARPQLRQPAGDRGGARHHALLARPRRRRAAPRRDPLPLASARGPIARTSPRRTRC